MGRSIRPRLTGVGRHVLNLVQSVARARPADPLTVFLTQDAPASTEPNIVEVRAPVPTPNEYARAAWEQTLVPWQASRRKIELYHSPNYILPLALRVPAVVTIHDVTYLDRALHKWTSHHYLKFFTAAALKQAKAVVAVSDYTRRQVERFYPATAGRVHVIYQGYDESFRPQAESDVQTFLQQQHIDHPFVLYVGTIEPRKNLVRLIEAFELALREGELPHHLYLVGSWGWKAGPVGEALQRVMATGRVHVTGYVTNEELALYYAAADVVAYPSIEEGFGLPAAEAMASGAAVITSNRSSLPEVVGDAAVMVAPYSVPELAGAILRVVTDSALRERLRAGGPAQAAHFSWKRSAEQHLALYEAVLGAA